MTTMGGRVLVGVRIIRIADGLVLRLPDQPQPRELLLSFCHLLVAALVHLGESLLPLGVGQAGQP